MTSTTLSTPSTRPALLIAVLTVFAVALGVTYPLLSMVLEAAGIDATLIGLNGAMTPLGLVLSAPLLPAVARRLGLRRSLGSCLAAMAVLLGALALVPPLVPWFPLRLLLGMAVNGMFVVGETWLILQARPGRRALLLAAYASAVSGGFALGPATLALTGAASPLPFAIAIACCALGLVALAPLRGTAEPGLGGGRLPLLPLLRRLGALLALVAALALFDHATITLLPVYMLRTGASEAVAALALTALIVGNIVLQLPVGWLADRIPRRYVLALCVCAGAAGGALLPLVLDTFWLWPLLLVWGGLTFAVYPVVLAVIGEDLGAGSVLTANAAFALVWGLAGIAGPALGGLAMDMAGPHGLPLMTALAWLAVLPAALRR